MNKSNDGSEVEKIIDELIVNAQSLVQASMHDPSEPVLEKLQKRQEKLLASLREAEKNNTVPINVSEKLERFGKLNREYIRNLANIHGVIYFQKKAFNSGEETEENS